MPRMSSRKPFCEAYKQLGRFESRANFGTWLHRIAVNCSIDLIRSRPKRESGHDAADLELIGAPPATSKAVEASPERLMLSAEVQQRITGAMSSLSQMERAAFVLRHFEGHSIDEISRALGLKVERRQALDFPGGEEDAGRARAVRAGRLTAGSERDDHACERRRPGAALLRRARAGRRGARRGARRASAASATPPSAGCSRC